MKAYVMNENHKLLVKEVTEPIATEDNIIVDIKYAAICGTDFRTFMHGNEDITTPRILGHEFVGVVRHSGFLAKNYGINVGDRVTVAPAIGCGLCWPYSTGHTNMCDHLKTIGFQFDGAFAEQMEIPKEAILMGNVIKIPDNISDMSAVLTEPAACALNAQEYLKIQKDDYVVIYGCGYIGCIHAEFAKLAGADKIIMVEINESRAEVAKEMIPDIILLNPNNQDTVKEVNELTGNRGANVVITALSDPSAQTEAQIITSKMGRISLFGGLSGESKGFIDSNLIHYKELSVYGAHATTAELMRKVMGLISDGKLNLEKYISTICNLEDIENGFASVRDQNAFKVIVEP